MPETEEVKWKGLRFETIWAFGNLYGRTDLEPKRKESRQPSTKGFVQLNGSRLAWVRHSNLLWVAISASREETMSVSWAIVTGLYWINLKSYSGNFDPRFASWLRQYGRTVSKMLPEQLAEWSKGQAIVEWSTWTWISFLKTTLRISMTKRKRK